MYVKKNVHMITENVKMVRKCHECGAKVESKYKFCDECGEKLLSKKEEQELKKEQREDEKRREERRKKLKKNAPKIALILCILALIILLPTKTQYYNVQVPYKTTEPYQAQESYTVQVPYQAQESYTVNKEVTRTRIVKEDNCDSSSGCVCTQKSWLGLGNTCVECSCDYQSNVPVTEYRTVTKYRTETKYRTVTKYREVTKEKTEQRTRKVNWLFNRCLFSCR